jgi:hypothetical protein
MVMRKQFDKYAKVKDLEIIDRLHFKGKLELEETKALVRS